MKKPKESFRSLILKDCFRYNGKDDLKEYIRNFYFNRGFRITYFYRKGQKRKGFLFNIRYKRMCNKYTIDLPLRTRIGKGLYIGHPFGIAVNGDSVIGHNVNISQNVTIGYKQRGDLSGSPVIGNNVYIGPGAVVIGKIKIGNNVVIGANSVVTKDVPDNAVVAGIPAKILSEEGSEGIVNNRCEW